MIAMLVSNLAKGELIHWLLICLMIMCHNPHVLEGKWNKLYNYKKAINPDVYTALVGHATYVNLRAYFTGCTIIRYMVIEMTTDQVPPWMMLDSSNGSLQGFPRQEHKGTWDIFVIGVGVTIGNQEKVCSSVMIRVNVIHDANSLWTSVDNYLSNSTDTKLLSDHPIGACSFSSSIVVATVVLDCSKCKNGTASLSSYINDIQRQFSIPRSLIQFSFKAGDQHLYKQLKTLFVLVSSGKPVDSPHPLILSWPLGCGPNVLLYSKYRHLQRRSLTSDLFRNQSEAVSYHITSGDLLPHKRQRRGVYFGSITAIDGTPVLTSPPPTFLTGGASLIPLTANVSVTVLASGKSAESPQNISKSTSYPEPFSKAFSMINATTSQPLYQISLSSDMSTAFTPTLTRLALSTHGEISSFVAMSRIDTVYTSISMPISFKLVPTRAQVNATSSQILVNFSTEATSFSLNKTLFTVHPNTTLRLAGSRFTFVSSDGPQISLSHSLSSTFEINSSSILGSVSNRTYSSSLLSQDVSFLKASHASITTHANYSSVSGLLHSTYSLNVFSSFSYERSLNIPEYASFSTTLMLNYSASSVSTASLLTLPRTLSVGPTARSMNASVGHSPSLLTVVDQSPSSSAFFDESPLSSVPVSTVDANATQFYTNSTLIFQQTSVPDLISMAFSSSIFVPTDLFVSSKDFRTTSFTVTTPQTTEALSVSIPSNLTLRELSLSSVDATTPLLPSLMLPTSSLVESTITPVITSPAESVTTIRMTSVVELQMTSPIESPVTLSMTLPLRSTVSQRQISKTMHSIFSGSLLSSVTASQRNQSLEISLFPTSTSRASPSFTKTGNRTDVPMTFVQSRTSTEGFPSEVPEPSTSTSNISSIPSTNISHVAIRSSIFSQHDTVASMRPFPTSILPMSSTGVEISDYRTSAIFVGISAFTNSASVLTLISHRTTIPSPTPSFRIESSSIHINTSNRLSFTEVPPSSYSLVLTVSKTRSTFTLTPKSSDISTSVSSRRVTVAIPSSAFVINTTTPATSILPSSSLVHKPSSSSLTISSFTSSLISPSFFISSFPSSSRILPLNSTFNLNFSRFVSSLVAPSSVDSIFTSAIHVASPMQSFASSFIFSSSSSFILSFASYSLPSFVIVTSLSSPFSIFSSPSAVMSSSFTQLISDSFPLIQSVIPFTELPSIASSIVALNTNSSVQLTSRVGSEGISTVAIPSATTVRLSSLRLTLLSAQQMTISGILSSTMSALRTGQSFASTTFQPASTQTKVLKPDFSPIASGNPISQISSVATSGAFKSEVSLEASVASSGEFATASIVKTEPSSSFTTLMPTPVPDLSPVLVNGLGYLRAQVGQLFIFQIPDNTFYDREDGLTSNLTLACLTIDGRDLAGSSWLHLDNKTKTLSGVPLTNDFTSQPSSGYQFLLVATDKAGNTAHDAFLVTIQRGSPKLVFLVTTKILRSYAQFMADTRLLVRFVTKIAIFLGTSDATSIFINSISNGSTVITWSNSSLSSASCPENVLTSLRDRIFDSSGQLHSEFVQGMLTDFPIVQGSFSRLGVCLSESSTTIAPPTGPSQVSKSVRFVELALPLLAVALILFVIIGVLIFTLRHRRKRPSLADRTIFRPGNPVILPNDFELKEFPRPVEKFQDEPPGYTIPPDFPESYIGPYENDEKNDTDSENEEEPTYLVPPPYLSPGPNRSGVPRTPPPAYRFPPLYTHTLTQTSKF